DEASVVEATGAAIFLIDGEYNNIKITHPSDLAVAEKILEAL
ncbi:MAG: 2-C-methyl-D-erythritol 4-phosphate cytidylyltransferase, partial [Bacteroidia bacterium]|nr:2-C-methyl-D-erythritol 4-phosphate cytidylyltransferase [Bacteroidia bacterium]